MPCLHRVFCSATKLPGTLQPLDLLSQERMILVQQQSSIKMKVLMSFLEIAGENTLFTIQYNTIQCFPRGGVLSLALRAKTFFVFSFPDRLKEGHGHRFLFTYSSVQTPNLERILCAVFFLRSFEFHKIGARVGRRN